MGLRLRTKFVVILVAITLVLGGSIFVTLESYQRDTVAETRSGVDQTARLVADQIDASIRTTLDDVGKVASRPRAREFDESDQFLAADLPTAVADPDLLQHLFENLFRNSIEHGGGDVTATVGNLPDGFYVADDGRGVPPAERERVFDPGYSTADGNTGLGLVIVRHIAEDHGWSVSLTESESGGARFDFTGVQAAESD